MLRQIRLEHNQKKYLEKIFSTLPRPTTVSDCISEMRLLNERQRIVADQMERLMGRSENRGAYSDSMEWREMSTISSAVCANIYPTQTTIHLGQVNSEERRTITESPEEIEEGEDLEILLREDTGIKTKKLAMTLHRDLGEGDDSEYNEESTPLVIALKKLQQKNVKMSGIKMWTNNLAELFDITDVDGSGSIEPFEYKMMINKLDISMAMKNALCNKFEEIDVNNDGSINLYEFLYFFLKFPKFNEELMVNAYNNAPYPNEQDLSTLQRLRLKVYLLIECPSHSIASKLLFCLDLMLSFVPVTFLIIQAMDPSHILNWNPKKYIWVISIFFAIQYVLGLVTCRTTRLFILDLSHTVDLVSFIFWIGYNTSILTAGSMDPMGFVLFRTLRIMKIHKVFNLEGLGENLAIYTDTLQLAYTSYGAVLGFLFVLILFYSLLFYAFERGEWSEEKGYWKREFDDEESPFSNLYNCVYFTIVTFTTLGYGDYSPSSHVGKLVAVTAVLTGLGNLTFLINIIGDCFEEVFRVFVQKRSRKIEQERANFIEKQIKRASELVKLRRKRGSRFLGYDSEFLFNRGRSSIREEKKSSISI